EITSDSQLSARIIVSFLNGTQDWQNVGDAPPQNQFLSVNGGVIATAQNANGPAVSMDSAIARRVGGSKDLNLPAHDAAYTDLVASGPMTLTAKAGSATAQRNFTLPTGGSYPFTIKTGPLIAPGGVLPAAAKVPPLAMAPGQFVAIYGDMLAAQTAQAP